jgi:integrase
MHYAFQIKKNAKRSAPTLVGYEFHMNRFLQWCKQQGKLGLNITEFTIDHFYEFHDWLRFEYVMEATTKTSKSKKKKKNTGEPLSGTSVNNHKRSLSALFTTLKNERFIATNFIKDIPMVDEEPVNNKAFSLEDLNIIKTELLKSDPYLIHYISFILYPLLRPREVCRLKVKDINTDKWFLSVQTKTEILSFRRIITKMKPTIEALQLHKYPGDFEVFSNIDRPKDWSDATLKSRVDTLGKRFRTVKNKLGYGREYGLYSFRHTAIMDLYNSLVKEGMGEQEILFKLMPITTHKSVSGIKSYLRRHQQSIPADHSHIFTLEF